MKIEELRKISRDTESAPWSKSSDDRDGMEWNCTVEAERGTVCFMARDPEDDEYSHGNADFIVAAHSHFPALIAVAEAAKALAAATRVNSGRDGYWLTLRTAAVRCEDALRALEAGK